MTLSSSAPNTVQVTPTGTLRALGLGSATITAARGSQSATASISVSPAAPAVLKHRYSFNEASGATTVTDSVGGQNGQVMPPDAGGTALSLTNGQMNFPGGAYQTAGYVALPGGMISTDTNIFTVNATGGLLPRNIGNASLIATFQNLSATAAVSVTAPVALRHEIASTTLNAGGVVINATLRGDFPSATNVNVNGYTGVTTLSNVTVEGWATWRGGANNQRFFDFGMSSGAPNTTGGFDEDTVLNPGRSYMFLSPQTGSPRFAIKEGTGPETPSLTSGIAIAQNASSHFALVYDPSNGVVRLYINGRRAGTAAATLPLRVVDDRNVWLGRSVWQDPLFNGLFDEFRIYNGPLMDSEIAASI